MPGPHLPPSPAALTRTAPPLPQVSQLEAADERMQAEQVRRKAAAAAANAAVAEIAAASSPAGAASDAPGSGVADSEDGSGSEEGGGGGKLDEGDDDEELEGMLREYRLVEALGRCGGWGAAGVWALGCGHWGVGGRVWGAARVCGLPGCGCKMQGCRHWVAGCGVRRCRVRNKPAGAIELRRVSWPRDAAAANVGACAWRRQPAGVGHPQRRSCWRSAKSSSHAVSLHAGPYSVGPRPPGHRG